MKRPLDIIVSDLVEAFNIVGREWFMHCCESTLQEWKKTAGTNVFDGDAWDAIGVMQYDALITLLNNPRVLTREEQKRFPTLYFSKQFLDPPIAAERLERYLSKDISTKLFSFAGDVAKHITGDSHPLEATMKFVSNIEALLMTTHLAAIEVFVRHGISPLPWWKRPFV
jgi:hypothetical protein